MTYTTQEMPCTANGRNIYGMLLTPEKAGGKMPAVILSHGYNSSHSDLFGIAAAFAENGAAAYCFDFCGGSVRSKSSGSTLDMTIPSELDDLFAVIGMVSSLPQTDPDRIYLYGESQGGYISALAAARRQDIAGLALLYPALCIPDVWQGKKMPAALDFMGMRISSRFAEQCPSGSVFDQICGYSGNVLIMHGECDRVVDIAWSEKAAEHYPNARLVRFPQEGHGFSPPAARRVAELAAEFFHLPNER